MFFSCGRGNPLTSTVTLPEIETVVTVWLCGAHDRRGSKTQRANKQKLRLL